jgi:hypothetical protein
MLVPGHRPYATRPRGGTESGFRRDAWRELASSVPNPSQAGVEVNRANGELVSLEQRLGPEEASKALSEVDRRLKADRFDVNPRFDGTPDPNTGQMLFKAPNWLAVSSGNQPVPVPSN